jgi:hypothetical protein
MANKRSEKSPFQSSYGGGWVSPAQYVTERLLVKVAAKDGTDLPSKFWNLPEWSKKFRTQIQAARSLFRIGYSAEAIIAALKDKRLWNIYSFRYFTATQKGQDILDEYQAKFEAKQSRPVEVNEGVVQTGKPRKPVGKQKNLLGKLRELDGRREEGKED